MESENYMVKILEDKLLSLRLKSCPEFQIRLAEFLHSYRVEDRPALVVQARRSPGSQGDFSNVDEPEVQKRFLAGVQTQNGWWQGFRSMGAVIPTFHGIASLPAREKPGWAAEMPRDGHFIAGIWQFPPVSVRGSDVAAIADFYVEMFKDFVLLVASVLKGASQPPTYEVTATLVDAHALHYAMRAHYGIREVVDPLAIHNLQWPLVAAQVGTSEWTSLAVQMGKALAGAYGDTPPEPQ